MRYIYEPGENELPERARRIIEDNDLPVEIVNASEWGDDRRYEFYQNNLVWKSVTSGKSLRGKIRTNNAGDIYFFRGVLIAEDDFYIGENAIDELKSMIPTKA